MTLFLGILGILMLICDIILFFEIIWYKKRNYKYTKYSIVIIVLFLLNLVNFTARAIEANNFGANSYTFKFITYTIFYIEIIILAIKNLVLKKRD